MENNSLRKWSVVGGIIRKDDDILLVANRRRGSSNVKKKGGTIYLDKNIKIIKEGASSVSNNKFQELEKNRNWHWMWSTFYFHKKH